MALSWQHGGEARLRPPTGWPRSSGTGDALRLWGFSALQVRGANERGAAVRAPPPGSACSLPTRRRAEPPAAPAAGAAAAPANALQCACGCCLSAFTKLAPAVPRRPHPSHSAPASSSCCCGTAWRRGRPLGVWTGDPCTRACRRRTRGRWPTWVLGDIQGLGVCRECRGPVLCGGGQGRAGRRRGGVGRAPTGGGGTRPSLSTLHPLTAVVPAPPGPRCSTAGCWRAYCMCPAARSGPQTAGTTPCYKRCWASAVPGRCWNAW